MFCNRIILKKCCFCCISLRNGCYIIAGFALVFWPTVLITYLIDTLVKPEKKPSTTSIFLLLVVVFEALMQMLLAVLLFITTYKKSPSYMAVWEDVTLMLYAIILLEFVVNMLEGPIETMRRVAYILFTIAKCLYHLYTLIVVHSYRVHLLNSDEYNPSDTKGTA
ncbi:Hypothetical protein NTJ_04862 [Nesidiocoris tenuis]|uniref:Ion transport domain-containing protein n=1 Tax=Nesidiocoris tenuis TaxID=355587 RepID=A0ABN7ALF1_9HEMI|nr:Hypothetical protein NTJ_04862 [Nesidiocoris tenuis]